MAVTTTAFIVVYCGTFGNRTTLVGEGCGGPVTAGLVPAHRGESCGGPVGAGLVPARRGESCGGPVGTGACPHPQGRRVAVAP